MNFFTETDVDYYKPDTQGGFATPYISMDKANALLIERGVVVYGHTQMSIPAYWGPHEDNRFDDSHRALVINIEEIEKKDSAETVLRELIGSYGDYSGLRKLEARVMSTEKLLSEIRERLEKATPGPWTLKPRNSCFFDDGGPLKPLSNELCLDEDSWNSDFLGASIIGPTDPGRGDFTVRDGWLIANAPQDLAKLIRIVEVLREGLERYCSVNQKMKMEDGDFILIDRYLTPAGEALAKADAIAEEGE